MLAHFGVNQKHLSKKHTDCPFCGGKDRYRYTNINGDGDYICGQCGNGDGMDLAMSALQMGFSNTVSEIRKIIGNATMETVKTEDYEKNLQNIKRIYAGKKDIVPGSAVSKYLEKRGITVLPDQCCYELNNMPYYEDGKITGRHPAMVSQFRTQAGAISTLHITYLDNDGNKANVETPRKLLPVARPFSGSACRLFNPDKILCITEGIETALAVHQLEEYPVWAMGSANNLEKFDAPTGSLDTLYIYCDEDTNGTGQRSAYTLQNRLKLKGEIEKVCVVRVINGMVFYDYGGLEEGTKSFDWNDFLNEEYLKKN